MSTNPSQHELMAIAKLASNSTNDFPFAMEAANLENESENAYEVVPNINNERTHASSPAPGTIEGSARAKVISNGNNGHRTIYTCQYEDLEKSDSGPCLKTPNTEPVDTRKVVSHIFGRNKKVTRCIPGELWTWYCRKHYQRSKYNCRSQWPQKQIDLVRLALDNFEQWGKIECWNIVLRKREQDRQKCSRRSDNAMQSTSISNPVSPGMPHFVYYYLDQDVSFNSVRKLVDEIERYIQGENKVAEGLAREGVQDVYGRAPQFKKFPDIEFLPIFTLEYQRLLDRNHEKCKRRSNLRAQNFGLELSSFKKLSDAL
ncbi:hypothetical protein TSTA_109940 [Talaromyces stipitatus ATCC 10500]|uniref:Uncharacterized protein n=1 Tax=Talaromyces stipitatus (strain ATCC 10500 / CBS 375.48 / QM 6759 / NRRL 1006) TaxID=441959 RepID=B8MUS6_TALSN|nr:uncharacterized protein TSTA_109940 [Talaromyces stipitatus ATCC 10500]EED11814.1 hypothetical protein TSTA_109940 [Talaromyces stipitatus ATCC 10500]